LRQDLIALENQIKMAQGRLPHLANLEEGREWNTPFVHYPVLLFDWCWTIYRFDARREALDFGERILAAVEAWLTVPKDHKEARMMLLFLDLDKFLYELVERLRRKPPSREQ